MGSRDTFSSGGGMAHEWMTLQDMSFAALPRKYRYVAPLARQRTWSVYHVVNYRFFWQEQFYSLDLLHW